MAACAVCEQKERIIAILERQLALREKEVETLAAQAATSLDKLVAITNPAALAVYRGEIPLGVDAAQVAPSAPPAEAARRAMTEYVNDKGEPCVMLEGALVPLEELNRVQATLDAVLSGGNSMSGGAQLC